MQRESTELSTVSLTVGDNKAQVSMRERIFNWRNAKLADADFHRWARRNPLTRYIARRRARSIFDLCAGFVYSQTLSACVELKLLQLLSNGAKTSQFIAKQCDLEQDACDVLVRSAVSLKLLQAVDQTRYGLGVHGAALLANPGVLKMVEHHAFFYRDLKDPVSLLRREEPTTMLSMFWNYSGQDNGVGNAMDSSAYTELMSASQSLIAEQILDCYSFRAHQCLLDVGGSDGTFLRTVGATVPDMSLMLFDLKPVVQHAEAHFTQSDLPNKVSFFGGDMFKDALPTGADLISLVRVVHDHNDDDVLALLIRCRQALPEGGTLLLAEPMAVERIGDPATDAYFGFYLHAMGQGKPRTATELRALLDKAGFTRMKEIKTQLPMLVRVLSAQVASSR